MNLTPELEEHRLEIREIAIGYGLDFFHTVFELVDYNELNTIAALGGFPNRYPHWRFGMEYERLIKSYEYGLAKIYELVINNDPCYAYLMSNNNIVDQKLVMAHVFGHCDFFKKNEWFSKTNRKMMDQMANNGSKVRKMIKSYGYETVEGFIDCCLSLENLIDMYRPFVQRKNDPSNKELSSNKINKNDSKIKRFKSKDYMDTFINPEEFIEKQKKDLIEKQKQMKQFPRYPQRDVLLFLLENAPLEKWQQNILSIIRDESYYFAPQMQTKIMNEGWATYWHSTMMTNDIMVDADIIDFADHHSGTVATQQGQLNPYKMGLELFRDIEDRWNKGKFGKEYEECDEYDQKRIWNKESGLGRKKIFEVRKVHNDLSFLDTFLTKDFAIKNKLFNYKFDPNQKVYYISDRDFKKIKKNLLSQLTNGGNPIIEVINGNYENKGELYLKHVYEGIPLKVDYAIETLRNLFTIWTRPVNLETIHKNREIIWRIEEKNGKLKEIEIKKIKKD